MGPKIVWDEIDIDDWHLFKTPPQGPVIFEADVRQDGVSEPLVEWLLESGLFVEWETWGAGTLEYRFPTQLTVKTKADLLADFAYIDEEEERYPCMTVVATSPSMAVDGRLPGRNTRISEFLKTGKGLDFIIYQPNDCAERIFLGRDSVAAKNLDNLLALSIFSTPILQYWVRTTIREGTLPP